MAPRSLCGKAFRSWNIGREKPSLTEEETSEEGKRSRRKKKKKKEKKKGRRKKKKKKNKEIRWTRVGVCESARKRERDGRNAKEHRRITGV